MTESEIIAGTPTRFLGKHVRLFDTIDSTNTAAKRFAQEGAPEGTIVVAEEQSAGRGRLGRSWESAKGVNLTFSVILRPRVAPSELGLLPLLAGVAVCETIRETCRLDAACKWPNDVLVGGKKVCGILSESLLQGDDVGAVIVGIGLNVNQAAFAPELAATATSLLLARGAACDRTGILCALLAGMEPLYDLFTGGRRGEIVARWSAAAPMIGRRVRVAGPGAVREGIAQGIAPDGALLITTGDGLLAVHAGDVTLREP
jgi:BirA family biotin operon repressor/biotin-[acetyl-CoA-carboxylase] ligase